MKKPAYVLATQKEINAFVFQCAQGDLLAAQKSYQSLKEKKTLTSTAPSALDCALDSQRLEIIRFLFENVEDWAKGDAQFYIKSFYVSSARTGFLEGFQLAIHFADSHNVSLVQSDAMACAASAGHLHILEHLLKNGASEADRLEGVKRAIWADRKDVMDFLYPKSPSSEIKVHLLQTALLAKNYPIFFELLKDIPKDQKLPFEFAVVASLPKIKDVLMSLLPYIDTKDYQKNLKFHSASVERQEFFQKQLEIYQATASKSSLKDAVSPIQNQKPKVSLRKF